MPQTVPESDCFPPDHRVNVLLDECLAQAQALMTSIRARVQRGDSAQEVVTTLHALVKAIIRLAPTDASTVADSTRQRIQDLVEAMRTARQEGNSWLQEVALPEMEALTRGQNGISVYRQRSRPS
jgi:hypothetical protein